MPSLKGHLLVASRHLQDPNFVQSVVLMIHHDDEGAMGVVLNRPGDKTIAEVWDMIDTDPCDNDEQVHVGGPVAGPLVAVHTVESFAEQELLPGLYVATHKDALDIIVRKQDEQFRLYSGHAGWGSGQLDGELEAGGWLTTAARLEDAFAEHDNLWKDVTQRIGLEIIAPDVKREHVPVDPSMN